MHCQKSNPPDPPQVKTEVEAPAPGRKRQEVRTGYIRTRDNKIYFVYGCPTPPLERMHSQYLSSHFKRVINPSRANDYGQAEVRVSIAGDDMSVGGTWTAYAFVIGKRNHFLLSEKEKKEYFEKDPDRRGSGTLGDFSVCNGCGKEKPLVIQRNGKSQIAIQDWISHKLRCRRLQ